MCGTGHWLLEGVFNPSPASLDDFMPLSKAGIKKKWLKSLCVEFHAFKHGRYGKKG